MYLIFDEVQFQGEIVIFKNIWYLLVTQTVTDSGIDFILSDVRKLRNICWFLNLLCSLALR